MIGLLPIAFFAGMIAGVSPCILPVLPVAFVAWTSPVGEEASAARLRRRRAVAVVLGLVASFSVVTLVGSEILSALGLPLDFLRDAGLVVLVLIGLGLLIPRLGVLMERPFVRLARGAPTGSSSGFVLGLALGAVFVPCAGPVLAAISVLGATHHVSFFTVLVTLCFSAGAAVPLLAIALAGERMVERNQRLKAAARRFRPVAGAVLIAIAIALNFNLANDLQTLIPGYTSALQNSVEGNSFTLHQLQSLKGTKSTDGKLSDCTSGASFLQRCGVAPNFTGITTWLNTPGDEPLTMKGLRGKVVLIDFWTYSCINCERSLPHVEAWNRLYSKDGLVIVGVHAPEFAFEHVVSNVKAAAVTLGVTYPIAVDDNLATWNAYNNEAWPAQYLIDPQGVVRHVDFGEGDYSQTESFIRTLLLENDPSLKLPKASEVANLTPTGEQSPETYLGLEGAQYYVNANLEPSIAYDYTMPSTVPLGGYGLGGVWTAHSQEITSGAGAKLTLHFLAQYVYLVLGGTGTIHASVNGTPATTITVKGVPGLYTMASFTSKVTGLLTLQCSPGVRAYDFTFG